MGEIRQRPKRPCHKYAGHKIKCSQLNGKRFDEPTWVELCGWHVGQARITVEEYYVPQPHVCVSCPPHNTKDK